MYRYKNLAPEKQRELLHHRRICGLPLHEPPHFADGIRTYHIAAACYEHRHVLNTSARRTDFAETLMASLEAIDGPELFAWAILPNHYHLLIRCNLDQLRPALGKLHNRTATRWNREDGTPGRKVWFRFTDRFMRSDRHFMATVNYIHANPVHHGYVESATDWPWSSLHQWLEQYGREKLVALWHAYPVLDMGKGWDE
ncbi:MAG: transposase [Kiritimatiellales bacterium]|nr:transposase [Kiritimatiellales bacterium]